MPYKEIYKPVNQEHLNFVELLLQILRTLDICSVIPRAYPAYIAGMFSSYFAVTLCKAKTNSTILRPPLTKNSEIHDWTF